jgi:hypothetical protein
MCDAAARILEFGASAAPRPGRQGQAEPALPHNAAADPPATRLGRLSPAHAQRPAALATLALPACFGGVPAAPLSPPAIGHTSRQPPPALRQCRRRANIAASHMSRQPPLRAPAVPGTLRHPADAVGHRPRVPTTSALLRRGAALPAPSGRHPGHAVEAAKACASSESPAPTYRLCVGDR